MKATAGTSRGPPNAGDEWNTGIRRHLTTRGARPTPLGGATRQPRRAVGPIHRDERSGAVIDTGVDAKNRQVTQAVDASSGANYLPTKNSRGEKTDRGNSQGTTETVGHGTRVAGSSRPAPVKGTGFVGLAPDIRIIPIKQNNTEEDGAASPWPRRSATPSTKVPMSSTSRRTRPTP